ncbi:hypothetical protein [Paraburkholderia sacchari]|uniref:hypothetical protein n=1 Tax=Paraburkholderia sacchari TaxID=159450 RepID=UPI001BD19D24|nr:hypothetical protein [Paraburkholderia sacchari]
MRCIPRRNSPDIQRTSLHRATAAGATGTDWRGELPADGQYTVQVYQMRASARRGTKVPYTITVDIR